MKKAPLTLLAAAALLGGTMTLSGTLALADSEHGKGKGHKNWTERLFERLDTNKDGVISKEEYAKRGVDRFGKVDTDKNGTLSRAEFEAKAIEHAQKRAKKRAARHFKRLDTNKDGVIDAKEAAVPGARRFARLDTDGDGKVTRAEVEAAKKQWRKGRHKGRHGHDKHRGHGRSGDGAGSEK